MFQGIACRSRRAEANERWTWDSREIPKGTLGKTPSDPRPPGRRPLPRHASRVGTGGRECRAPGTHPVTLFRFGLVPIQLGSDWGRTQILLAYPCHGFTARLGIGQRTAAHDSNGCMPDSAQACGGVGLGSDPNFACLSLSRLHNAPRYRARTSAAHDSNGCMPDSARACGGIPCSAGASLLEVNRRLYSARK